MKYIINETQLREYIKNAILETIDTKQAAALMGRTQDDYDNNFQFLQKRARNMFYKGNDALQGVNAYDEMMKEFASEMRRINNAVRYIRTHNGMVQQLDPAQKAKKAATRQQNAQLKAQYMQQTGAQRPQYGTNYQYLQKDKDHPDFINYSRQNVGGRSVNNVGQTSTPTNIGGTNMPKRGRFGNIFEAVDEGLFGNIKQKINANKMQQTIDACEQLIASAKSINNQQKAEQTIAQLRQYYQQFKEWYNQLNGIKTSIMQNSGVVDQNAEDRKTFNKGFNNFKKNQAQKQYRKTGTNNN